LSSFRPFSRNIDAEYIFKSIIWGSEIYRCNNSDRWCWVMDRSCDITGIPIFDQDQIAILARSAKHGLARWVLQRRNDRIGKENEKNCPDQL
jgi:hypothetical protein